MSALRSSEGATTRKAFRSGVAAALAVAGLTVAGPVASAEAAPVARNGKCEANEFCYYYADKSTSVSDFKDSVPNYGTAEATCYDFRGVGAGKGECVKNNALYVWNRSSHAVTVYYNSGYSGISETFASGEEGFLDTRLLDQNASHKFR